MGQEPDLLRRRRWAVETLPTRDLPALPAHPLARPPTRAPSAATDLALDRYALLKRLGAGGFGTVWLARDERLGREVAVKVIPRGLAAATDHRPLREALAVARLAHPGIVALYEAGEDAEDYYLVSEVVHGRTLAALEAAGPLADAVVLRVGLVLCDALAHAHERGVIHRDVKPQNVIVCDGATGHGSAAKLTDFGVARLVGEDALTHSGDVVGTLAYMAPEQAQGHRVGAPADLYALALVLYEALSGVNPVRGSSPADTVRRLARGPESLARVRSDLSGPLTEAIDGALSADPLARGSLDDLRAALADASEAASGGGSAVASDITRAGRPSIESGRHAGRIAGPGRVGAGVGAGVLAALAVAHLGPAVPAGPLAPPAPLSVAAVVALGVVVFPRVGWLLGAGTLVAWLLSAHGGGDAVLVALACGSSVLLLPRWPQGWSWPAGAVLLGLLGAAAAFPALAGQARSLPRRALLAAAGFWWLCLGEALTGRRLLLGPAAGTPSHVTWQASPVGAALHAVGPLVLGGVWMVGLAWALAAAVLPWLVRGRGVGADVLGASVWAGGLVMGTQALAGMVGHGARSEAPTRAILSAVIAGAVAVGARALAGAASRGPDIGPRPHPG